MTGIRVNGVPANRGGLSRIGSYWLGRCLPGRPSGVSPDWWRDFARHVAEGVTIRALCDERGTTYPLLRAELDRVHRAAVVAGGYPDPRVVDRAIPKEEAE